MQTCELICNILSSLSVITKAQFEVDYKSSIIIDKNVSFQCDIKENFILGENIEMVLSIKSEEELTIYNFKTARLDFQIKRESNYNYPPIAIPTYRGGNYFITSDGIFTKIFPQKQEEVLVNNSGIYSAPINLNELFPNILMLGNYTLSICYEGQLFINKSFSIVLNYEKSVPLILENIEESGISDRYWKQVLFYSIFPYDKVWYSKEKENEEFIKEKSRKLNEYWTSAAICK